MQKIQSLFHRNFDGDRLVRDEVVPGSEWVQNGEGIATRKLDGTCCLIRDGKLYKRYEVKVGGKHPHLFEPAGDVDANTGKQQGWVPVGDGPEDKWHREAFRPDLPDGTYELVGPKVQGNPEEYAKHVLLKHGLVVFYDDPPKTFSELKEWFEHHNYIEGIVWHHPDGRMVKLKLKDFGLEREKRDA